MSTVDLLSRRAVRRLRDDMTSDRLVRVTRRFTEQGSDLADMALPAIGPYPVRDPDLEQHIKGAFLRWKAQQIKRELHDGVDHDLVGLAVTMMIYGFTDRMTDLQTLESPDGGTAA